MLEGPQLLLYKEVAVLHQRSTEAAPEVAEKGGGNNIKELIFKVTCYTAIDKLDT